MMWGWDDGMGQNLKSPVGVAKDSLDRLAGTGGRSDVVGPRGGRLGWGGGPRRCLVVVQNQSQGSPLRQSKAEAN